MRPLGRFPHIGDQHFEPVADAIAGADGLLAIRQDALGPADVHQNVAALEALDDSRDDRFGPADIFVENPLALGVAQPLGDDLLGRLGGDAAEIGGIDFDFDFDADFQFRVLRQIQRFSLEQFSRFLQADFRARIVHILVADHGFRDIDRQAAAFQVELGPGVAELRKVFLRSRKNRRFDGFANRFDIQVFFLGYRADKIFQRHIHGSPVSSAM